MENYFFSKTISIKGLIFNNWCEFATSSVHLVQKDVLAQALNLVEACLVQERLYILWVPGVPQQTSSDQ